MAAGSTRGNESYDTFIRGKSQYGRDTGFDPTFMPDFLFDFQSALTDWAIRKGRAALFEECGLGKTAQQLVWAENVVRHTNKPVMLVTPLAVGQQTCAEAEKFGIEAKRTRDGKMTADKCVFVTNYEQLAKYNPDDFGGMVCDESSAIKDFKSERKATVGEFSRKMRYRLLCTATAAPNDYWELGTSSEVLGYLGFRDMITTFFKQETAKDYLGWGRTKYRFRGHAEQPFWSWVCSWARSLRKPSDLGFDDTRFVLPPLHEHTIVVQTAKPRKGCLFTMPAKDMQEERAERRHSVKERVAKAADIAHAHAGASVIWCDSNEEADLCEKTIDGAKQISGSMSDDKKEELFIAFATGQLERLVIKPKIGAWGLNWQHCCNVISFPTHSFEQDYQLVRRCYRFGQKNPVHVHRIVSEGEVRIIENHERKRRQSDVMFASIVKHMNDAMHLVSQDFFPEKETLPAWLSSTK